jgi:pimeloyl-ACP methyl ester carboxylesterase
MRRLLFPKRGKHYVRNVLIRFLIGLFLALFVVVPLVLTYFLGHPRRYPVCCSTPADMGFTYENVTFPASDGTKLSGWYIPSTNGAAVIAVHANNGNRTGVMYHAQFLAEKGYGVLLFDVRGFGESEGNLIPFPAGGMSEDVIGAVSYLQKRPDVDPQRIGALGLSMGAIMVLRAAAVDDNIRAVVADGADETNTNTDDIPEFKDTPPLLKSYIRFVGSISYRLMGITTEHAGPRVSEGIAHISPRPVLLISAGTGQEQKANRLFYENANEPKILWEMPDEVHINGLFARTDEYKTRVLTLFDQALQAA